MWILLLAAALAAGWFTYTGLATRCPWCGLFKLHAKDSAATAEAARTRQWMRQVGVPHPLGHDSRFGATVFRCSRCGHTFDRGTAVIWLETANRLGEYAATSEYRKIREESDE